MSADEAISPFEPDHPHNGTTVYNFVASYARQFMNATARCNYSPNGVLPPKNQSFWHSAYCITSNMRMIHVIRPDSTKEA